jgi:hypothetical protein
MVRFDNQPLTSKREGNMAVDWLNVVILPIIPAVVGGLILAFIPAVRTAVYDFFFKVGHGLQKRPGLLR